MLDRWVWRPGGGSRLDSGEKWARESTFHVQSVVAGSPLSSLSFRMSVGTVVACMMGR